MEIVLLFSSLIANLLFSYIGLWAASKLSDSKKRQSPKLLVLYLFSIGAMVAAFVATFFYIPLGVLVLFLCMLFGAKVILGLSGKQTAQFAIIYTVIIAALFSLESRLVSVLLSIK